MLNKNVINLLSKMTNNTNSNLKNIKKVFESIHYIDDEDQSILHILVNDKYDEQKCFLAIETLLKKGLNPNLTDYFEYNFIQTALYAGYSEEFILKIIKEALKYNLNVNHVDEDKDSIMHTVIYSDDYLGEIERIYDLLCDNGFDSSLVDCNGRNLIDAMIFQKQYSKEQVFSFALKVEKRLTNMQNKEVKNVSNVTVKQDVPVSPKKQTISDKDIFELEKYGKILTNKNYIVSPTIGREKELRNLMISLAQDKKSPLLVGESGVGKTAIVEELAYRIKTGQVPNFLQDKIILEVNPSDIVAGCQYVGQFENNMAKLMKLCEKLDVIVFIDEIHTVYGIGSTKGKNNDMAAMLKHCIDKSNLKVVGITTEKEYQEFFSQDALKRRFEKITIKEPAQDILYQIIDKIIEDYYVKNAIFFKNENLKKDIENIILSATEKNHRVYNDRVNNPDLAISIIDKAFAIAKFSDSNFIKVEHFIESFEYCDRIYEPAREQAISKLRNLDTSKSKTIQKIFEINFNKSKK